MDKFRECSECGIEYKLHRDKLGPVYMCNECGEEYETEDFYTGNMIYDHKVGASIQINTDPALTQYINQSTKLRNKGSNLGNNLKVDSSMAKSGGMHTSAGGRNRRRE
jgi:hypothetical protein